MKLCCLLPKVKATLKIPADKHLLQQLEMCVRKLLCQEKDKDVLAIVKRVSIPLTTISARLREESVRFSVPVLARQDSNVSKYLHRCSSSSRNWLG